MDLISKTAFFQTLVIHIFTFLGNYVIKRTSIATRFEEWNSFIKIKKKWFWYFCVCNRTHNGMLLLKKPAAVTNTIQYFLIFLYMKYEF